MTFFRVFAKILTSAKVTEKPKAYPKMLLAFRFSTNSFCNRDAKNHCNKKPFTVFDELEPKSPTKKYFHTLPLSNTFDFNVKRHEPELIGPKQPKPHEIKQLSDIDDQYRFLFPVLFFYGPAGSGPDPVEKFREGLAKALTFYYPLAGRVFEGPDGKLMVNCNNEGVLFVEADADVKLEELGDGILPPCPYMEEKFLCSGVPSGPPGDLKMVIGCPLLFVQVTRFICGGFALGIQTNHTMVDGSGLMLFLNAIRELMCGAPTPSIPPLWQRELLNARSPPRITRTHNEFDFKSENKVPNPNLDEDNAIRMHVFFSSKEIQALRDKLPSQYPSCSRFELMTACIWKCRTIALEPDPEQIVRISIITNVRGRKGLGLPVGYYGNAFVYTTAVSEGKVLCTSPLTYAIELIQQCKSYLDEEYTRSMIDCSKHHRRLRHWNNFVSNATHLGFDKLDLGWGEPLYGGIPWASSYYTVHSVMKNNIGKDGVLISLGLPRLAVEKFQNELRKMMAEPIRKL